MEVTQIYKEVGQLFVFVYKTLINLQELWSVFIA